MEGVAADQLVVAAGGGRDTPHHPRPPEASTRSAIVPAARRSGDARNKGSNNAMPISSASSISSRSPVVRALLPAHHAVK